MNIYLDVGSIENAILRRHPEIKRCATFLDRTNSHIFAIVSDTTLCKDGDTIEVYRRDTVDYHGFAVEIARWRPVQGEGERRDG